MIKKLRKRFLLSSLCALLLGCSLAGYKAYGNDKDPIQPAQNLTIFDSKGKKVGNFLGFSSGAAIVAFRVNAELVVLYIHTFGYADGGFLMRNSDLYFESSNCTGTPFNSSGGLVGLAPFHILDGTKVYSLDGPLKTIIPKSRGSTSYPDTCQPVDPGPTNATPLRFLIDLGTQFQPPFTLK